MAKHLTSGDRHNDRLSELALNSKIDILRERLLRLGPLLIAFSGGVDSLFLLKIAEEMPAKAVLAVTWVSPLHPSWEREQVEAVVASLRAEHMFIHTDKLDSNIKLGKVPK